MFGSDPVALGERAGERRVGAIANLCGDYVDRVLSRAEMVCGDLEAHLRDVGRGRETNALGEALRERRAAARPARRAQ